MARPFYAFLLADEVNKPAVWAAFGLPDGYVACHRHKGGQHPAWPTVPHVPTSWEKTLLAHFELMRAMMATDATHFVLLSESCVPLVTHEEVAECLVTGKSYFTKWQDPCPFRTQRWRAIPNVLLNGVNWRDYSVAHEQWVILCREHVQLVLDHEHWLRQNLAQSNADNEHYSGTLLYVLGQSGNIEKGRYWYIEWPRPSAPHPRTLRGITQDQAIAWKGHGSLFARKAAPNTSTTYSLNGATLEEMKPVPAVLVHLYYYDTWQHLTTYLNQVPEPYALYVNVSQGDGDAAAIEAVKRYRPDATIYHLPNLGRDIWPLWRMMADLPADTPYWAFMHGKKSTHVTHRRSPFYGANWRKGLLTPIMGSEAQIRRCWQMIDDGAGIVGARAWVHEVRDMDKQERGLELLKRAGIDRTGGKAVFGSMFWASGKLLPHLLALDITQDDFYPHNKRDGLIEFALERMIGLVAKHNDLPVHPI